MTFRHVVLLKFTDGTTDAVYTATVTLGDGKTVEQSYPAGEVK